ncbi:MAG: redoxin domain-containing protein [Prevotella sp.]|nr:redoxin domain-containing protein [Prevotella sp.]
MKRSISTIFAVSAAVVLTICSCTGRSFNVSGTITEAKDSVLYLENMSLSGPVAIDSVKLSESGTFSFSHQTPEAPEFYRLRIAGQIINLAVDSTEQIKVDAQYPTMSAVYDVSGSDECAKIKELALHQMDLQRQVDAIVAAPDLGVEAVRDSVERVVTAYKEQVKRDYIFSQPMRAYAYYALFQTLRLGQMESLIFNPRSNEQDVKVFAAVATSWDTYYPDAERGKNLHNIAIEGMKNIRILQQRQLSNIDPSLVNVSNVIDINLPDNKGQQRRLTDLKGKVVLLDFHVFASEGSTARIMQLRDIYNKFHAQGLEIYQVSLDPDEHFWKTQTAALPWVCVRDERGPQSDYVVSYNIQSIPTFFLLGRNSDLYKRDAQIKDLEAEIRSLL